MHILVSRKAFEVAEKLHFIGSQHFGVLVTTKNTRLSRKPFIRGKKKSTFLAYLNLITPNNCQATNTAVEANCSLNIHRY